MMKKIYNTIHIKSILKHSIRIGLAMGVFFGMTSCNIVQTEDTENLLKKEGIIYSDVFIQENTKLKKSDKVVIRIKESADSNIYLKKLTKNKNAKNAEHESTVITIGDKIFIATSGIETNINNIYANNDVLYVEYDVERYIFDVPTDSLYTAQYAPQLTGLESVWDNYTGSGVVVGVIDTGINTLHEDFKGPDGGPATFIEGYDYIGKQVYAINANHDSQGHGTHVAGIIGARKNNGTGIVGVAPEVTLVAYRAGDSRGRFTSTDSAQAITDAANDGVDILNMSYGGLTVSNIEAAAVNFAISNGVTLVAAAGNDYISLKNYPASFPGIIAVASSNAADKISSYSTRSPLISVAAPGEDIMSLNAHNTSGYVSLPGTSMAAPFVAGVAALIKEKHPNATPAQIKELIESTAKDINIAGFDEAAGHGRIQPAAALTNPLPNIAWVEVSFDIAYGATPTPIEGYTIAVFDSGNNVHSLFTNAAGTAIAFLPDGDYNFASNLYGVKYGGNFSIDSATSSTKITLNQTFLPANFANNYYRIATYSLDTNINNSADTFLLLIKQNPVTFLYDTVVGSNDDAFEGTTFSEIVFRANAGDRFLVHVQSSFGTGTGDYRIIVERGISNSISKTLPINSGGFNEDETNSNGLDDPEELVLTVDNPRYGSISVEGDIDVFTFYP